MQANIWILRSSVELTKYLYVEIDLIVFFQIEKLFFGANFINKKWNKIKVKIVVFSFNYRNFHVNHNGSFALYLRIFLIEIITKLIIHRQLVGFCFLHDFNLVWIFLNPVSGTKSLIDHIQRIAAFSISNEWFSVFVARNTVQSFYSHKIWWP